MDEKEPFRCSAPAAYASVFTELYPSESCAPSRKVLELADGPQRVWQNDHYWKRPSARVKEVGVYVLNDASIVAPGVVIYCGEIFNDGSVSTNVSIRNYLENGTEVSRLNTQKTDGTVILIDGFGYKVWGHWLVDFAPRLQLAREALGSSYSSCSILIPKDTPIFVTKLINFMFGRGTPKFIFYTPGVDLVQADRLIFPSFCYTDEYTFHSFFKEFYSQPHLQKSLNCSKKICVSRTGSGFTAERPFAHRHIFERCAQAFGFDVIKPQDLTIEDQFSLFNSASVIIGEYGSALHSAVFSNPGTVVGAVGHWNSIQMRIGEIFYHEQVYLTRGCHWGADNNLEIKSSETDLYAFFERIMSF